MKLRVADHPVELLYFQGWWDLAESRGVAVVGTRTPSAESALERGDWFAVLSTINSRLFRALRRASTPLPTARRLNTEDRPNPTENRIFFPERNIFRSATLRCPL